MEKTIANLAEYWNAHYSHIEFAVSEGTAQRYLDTFDSVEQAANSLADYIVSQSLGEVVE